MLTIRRKRKGYFFVLLIAIDNKREQTIINDYLCGVNVSSSSVSE
jgi:hypothetical protein